MAATRRRRSAAKTQTQQTTNTNGKRKTCGRCLACNVLGCDACPCHEKPQGAQGKLVRLEARAERGKLEEPFWAQLRAALPAEGLPLPVRQAAWHPIRRFRADFLWPHSTGIGLIVEIDGGTWAQDDKAKGHGMGPGYDRNCRRDAEAVICGYRTLRFTAPMVRSGEALEYTIAALKALAPLSHTAAARRAA